jgi:hypothetical protein
MISSRCSRRASAQDHERAMDPELNQARRTLADWQSRK